VQRYLTGESVAQSRLGLLFNGLVKVPMQFFILFLGAMVFAFYQFTAPPVFFNPVEAERARAGARGAEFRAAEEEYARASAEKQARAREFVETLRAGDAAATEAAEASLLAADARAREVRGRAVEVLKSQTGRPDDTNYVFLNFVIHHLPAGVVGIVFAAVFFASMSSCASALNALASTTVVDVQRRLVRRGEGERYYLVSSKLATVFWGLFAMTFAQYAGQLGSLVEAVNRLGSLFYGTILGIFLLAFYFRAVGGTAAFVGAVAGEALILFCFFYQIPVAYLWYNVIGAAAVILIALAVNPFLKAEGGR